MTRESEKKRAVRRVRRMWTRGYVGLGFLALIISFVVSGESRWLLRGLGLVMLLTAMVSGWYLDRRLGEIYDGASADND